MPSDIDVVVAPPFIFLDWVRANINNQYRVAAQNCWVKSDGAFTGEISAEMLQDAHIPWVITGHSERRSLCSESNRTVGEKTGHALDVGLQVSVDVVGGAAVACLQCSQGVTRWIERQMLLPGCRVGLQAFLQQHACAGKEVCHHISTT